MKNSVSVSNSDSRKHARTNLTPGRKWLFIFVLTVVLPIVIFLLLEAGLRIVGYGYRTDFFLKREINGQEFLVDDPEFSLRYFPPALARPAQHMAIPVEKPPGTFRIVVLGGSAAMGDPDFSFGFSRMLETLLQYQHPDMKIQVINAAVTAINSNVVLPIARDCVKLQPDLFVVYLGNNEVIGPYGPGTVFAPFSSNLGLIRASIFLKSTKTVQLLDNLGRRLQPNGTTMQTWNGVGMFIKNRLRFDDPQMENVYEHFRKNLKDICEVGRDAGASVIVSTVPTNLKDCAPFAALHHQGLGESDLHQWETVYESGVAAEDSGNSEQAIASYQQAATIDGDFADLHFRLARSYRSLGRQDSALLQYEKARDLDALRFRADTRINNIIREVAGEHSAQGISLLDAANTFLSENERDIPGENIFYDHVHLNFNGNYLLARSVAARVDSLLGTDGQRRILTEAECEGRLAFTPWDKYRMEHEILERMKSPAFANRLDNAESVRRWEVKLDSLRATLNPDALTKAIQRYHRAIALNKEDWVLRNNFGLLLLETANDPVSAIEQFRYVLHRFPDDYLTLNNLGLAYVQQGRLKEAFSSYQKALQIKPGYPKTHYNLGEVLERQGKYKQAIAQYAQAALVPQALAQIHNRFGKRLANEGKVEEAIKHFHEALRLWPKLSDAQRNLGVVFAQTGKIDSAIQHLSDAIKLRPDLAQAYIDFASLLFNQEDYEGAIRYYRQALRINPDLPEVQNNLGLALCNLGEFSEAIPHFQAAIADKQDYLAARNNLAGALSRLGRNEEAITQLRELVRLSPDNPGLHNNLGAELLKIGEIEQAIIHFKKALQLDPGSHSAKNNLKYAMSLVEEHDK